MQEFIRLNASFIPPQDIVDKALQIVAQVGTEYEKIFVIDNMRFLPHITIYSPEYPEHNLNGLSERLSDIVSELESPVFEFDKLVFEDGYLGINFRLTNDIKFIHQQIVLGLNEFREDRIRDKYNDPEVLKEYTDQQKENIKQYGYTNVFDSYIPHLTLGRFKSSQMDIYLESFPSFEVHNIGIFTMGDNGTCREIVKKFQLNK